MIVSQNGLIARAARMIGSEKRAQKQLRKYYVDYNDTATISSRLKEKGLNDHNI